MGHFGDSGLDKEEIVLREALLRLAANRVALAVERSSTDTWEIVSNAKRITSEYRRINELGRRIVLMETGQI